MSVFIKNYRLEFYKDHETIAIFHVAAPDSLSAEGIGDRLIQDHNKNSRDKIIVKAFLV